MPFTIRYLNGGGRLWHTYLLSSCRCCCGCCIHFIISFHHSIFILNRFVYKMYSIFVMAFYCIYYPFCNRTYHIYTASFRWNRANQHFLDFCVCVSFISNVNWVKLLTFIYTAHQCKFIFHFICCTVLCCLLLDYFLLLVLCSSLFCTTIVCTEHEILVGEKFSTQTFTHTHIHTDLYNSHEKCTVNSILSSFLPPFLPFMTS